MPVNCLKAKAQRAKDRLAIVLLCLGFGAFGAGGTVAIDRIARENENKVDQQTLTESCERFGNTLRAGLREYFNSQVRESENFDYTKFFPNVNEDELEKALAAERARLEYNINVRFKDVPCKRVYK